MKYLLLNTILLLSASCSTSMKNTLGITDTMPDEYQTQRVRSLEVPPHYQSNKN